MNIYVGNLSYGTTEDGLRELFAEYGEVVSISLINDRETGRSKGFGFVEMADRKAGEEAIKGLNSRDVDGRTLQINEARPRAERRNKSTW